MQTADYDEFKLALIRFTRLWPKREFDKPETANELLEIYWRALKDQSLPVFRRFCERHEKFGRGFPRPSDLRAKEDRLPDIPGSRDDSGSRAADERCIRNLEELRRKDPQAHQREVSIRSMARIMATQSPGSSMYETAANELRVLNAENGRW